MRLSKIIDKIERYFLNRQFSYKYKRNLTCFQIDFFNLPSNLKKFLSIKERRAQKVFNNKELEFNNKIVKEGSKKDPTIDQYISEKGGIKSHLDNKVYTTKASYLDSIKSQGHHINE